MSTIAHTEAREQRGAHRGVSLDTWERLRPPPAMAFWDWLGENGRGADGRTPLDRDRIPWCQGVSEALDDPHYREIVLQWAARLAKTLLCHNYLLFKVDRDPQNLLLGLPTEQLVKRQVKQKVWRMAQRCPPLVEHFRRNGVAINEQPNSKSARSCREPGPVPSWPWMQRASHANMENCTVIDKRHPSIRGIIVVDNKSCIGCFGWTAAIWAACRTR